MSFCHHQFHLVRDFWYKATKLREYAKVQNVSCHISDDNFYIFDTIQWFLFVFIARHSSKYFKSLKQDEHAQVFL